MEERARFSFVENQVSIMDLLKIQRNRNIDSTKHLYCCLGDESQYIDLAYFRKCWRDNDGDSSICMNFFLTKIGNIVCEKPIGVNIEYHDGELFLLHEEMLKLELLKGKKGRSR